MKRVNRCIYAAIGVAALFFSGIVYAWSVLSVPIAAQFPEWTKAQLSMTFTITMIFFCVGCTSGGFMIKNIKAGILIACSAVLYLRGFYATSEVRSPVSLYLGFGVVCGFASGLSYNAVMGTVGKWFPDKQGLISGILLMGFGISSFITGKVFQALTAAQPENWRRVFIWFGFAAAAVMIATAFFIKKPDSDFRLPEAEQKKISSGEAEITTAEMLKKPCFWLYYVWAVLLSAAGLALVSQASGVVLEVDEDISASTLATAVGIISVANGAGRVILGWAYDRFGRGLIMQTVNIAFIACALVLALAIRLDSFALMIAGFVLGGLAYGGVTPTNSAFISSYFGMKNYPLNFSMINTNLIIASFGSTVAGALYDAAESYFSTCMMIFTLATIGIFFSWRINYKK